MNAIRGDISFPLTISAQHFPMKFEPKVFPKDGTVSRSFLRRQFWIAALVLLVALATSVGIVFVVLERQAAKGDFFMAFHDLGNDAMRCDAIGTGTPAAVALGG